MTRSRLLLFVATQSQFKLIYGYDWFGARQKQKNSTEWPGAGLQ